MKTIKYLILTVIAIIVAILPCNGATRRALVIGLGTQLDKSWPKINGDRDVAPVVNMLKSNGFADITTLVNGQATKAAITGSFESLIDRAGEGDVVYIHFSGHGQMMTDLDGDEEDDKAEAWIPYDAYMTYCSSDRVEKHLSDDEIAVYMTRLRSKVGDTGVIAVIVDACHSGHSTRGDEADGDPVVVRGVDTDFKIPGKREATHSRQSDETWLTLSACRDYQLNQEYRGNGKLSHILVNNWRRYAGLSDEAIYNSINDSYVTRQYKSKREQNPELSGQTGNVLSVIFRKKWHLHP